MIALELPPPLWTPPRPAIVRSVSREDLKLIQAARREHQGLFPFPVFCPSSFATIAATDVKTSAAASDPHTFVASAIGAAAPDRRVVVAVCSITNAITACTVGGAATTLIGSAGATTRWTALFVTSAAFTSGTTADVIITGGGAEKTIVVYRLLGAPSSTVFHSQTDSTSALSVALNIPAFGCAVAVANTNAAASSPVGLTQDYLNQSVNFGDAYWSGNLTAAETGRTVSIGGASGSCGMVAASWSPWT